MSDWRAAAREIQRRQDAEALGASVLDGPWRWRAMRTACHAELRAYPDGVIWRWEESDRHGRPAWWLELCLCAIQHAGTLTRAQVRRAYRPVGPAALAVLDRHGRLGDDHDHDRDDPSPSAG